MKNLSQSSIFTSQQFYTDIIMLLFQPLPFYDPTYTMNCINAADKT